MDAAAIDNLPDNLLDGADPQHHDDEEPEIGEQVIDKGGSKYEQLITRDGYRYVLNCKYKDKLFYKCEDKKNIGCKGVWKLYINPN